MNRSLPQSSGFTLIELLIVVAIIAILAAIAVPNFLEAQVRSKVSRTKADMRSVTTALEAYSVDYNKYPPSWRGPDVPPIGPTSETEWGVVAAPVNPRIQRLAWLTTPIAFMTTIPNDPFAVGTQDADPINQRLPVFTYWDPAFVAIRLQASGAETHFEDMPEMLNSLGTWELIGYGPDQIFHPAAFWPQQRVYDPTNGTVSEGDIIRYRGGVVE